MTLRSRLSAAWRAFRQDDFPPADSGLATPGFATFKREAACLHWLKGGNDWYGGPRAGCPEHGANPPVRLDLKPNTTYHVSAPKSEAEYADEMRAASRPSMADECEAMRIDMSPHPLPSAVDEIEAIRAEEQRELSKLTPGVAITDVWYEDNFGNLWSATVRDGRVVPTGCPRSGVSNLEVPAIIRKRRKKLESVKK